MVIFCICFIISISIRINLSMRICQGIRLRMSLFSRLLLRCDDFAPVILCCVAASYVRRMVVACVYSQKSPHRRAIAIGNCSCDSRLLHRPMRYSSLLSTSSSSRIESSVVGGVAIFFAAALAIFIVTVRVCFPRSVYVATSSHHIFAVLSRLVFSLFYLPRFLAVLSFPIVSSCRFAVLAFSLAFSSSAITFSFVRLSFCFCFCKCDCVVDSLSCC